MARRKLPEEQERHERWLVSYADFITLLFAFFVVMYSTSSVNEGKMRVLSNSLVASFTGRPKSLEPIQVGELVRSPYIDRTSPLTVPSELLVVAPPEPVAPLRDEMPGETPAEPADRGHSSAEMADVSTVTESIRERMTTRIELQEIALREKQSWLEIELDSSKLFISGSARIAREAIPTLGQLAGVLSEFSNPIQVEGFTDNLPIRTAAFPSNWELSAARAASVVHLFTKAGIGPARMVAIGYGEHRPVADNATAAGRARNRRVVLVIPADRETRRILDTGGELEVTQGGG